MSWLDGCSIHQVLVTAAPGDAITDSAMAIRSILRQHGKSEIFACNVHQDLNGEVWDISDYESASAGDAAELTLAHVSMGDPRFLPFLSRLSGELVLSYHNITPSSFFAPWDAATASLLDLGRTYLPALRGRAVLGLADSSFNAKDLHDAGYRAVAVGGLILGTERLVDVEPAPLRDEIDGPVVLSVGQLYPHKRADLMIASFHELVSRHVPDAHLVLAGSSRLPAYARAVERYVHDLQMDARVTVTGHIPEEELVAWYRRADLFLVASEHEGFCVPLVEAMQFEIPIVARANGATAETLGDAGILVPGDTGPSTLAAVTSAVLGDTAACDALRRRGRCRRSQFTTEACRRRFLEVLEEIRP